MPSSSSPPPSIDAPSLPLDHPLSQAAASATTPSSPERPSSSAPAPEAEIPIPQNILNDPPPPYPHSNRLRRSRGTGRSSRRVSAQHAQMPSFESDGANDAVVVAVQRSPRMSTIRPLDTHDSSAANETTPLLGVPGSSHPLNRPRSLSQSSINSFAPSLASLAQTAWVFFSECDSDDDGEVGNEDGEEGRCRGSGGGGSDPGDVEHPPAQTGGSGHLNLDTQPQSQSLLHHHPTRRRGGFFSLQPWRIYFRPLFKPVYWRSLTHLALINFPFALVAWVYLFVFTVTGTTLLIALPLGAILCFFNLLGARTFARAELLIQTKFHRPLHYPLSVLQYAHAVQHSTSSATDGVDPVEFLIMRYPIFTRTRPPSASELESGQAVVGEEVVEGSFYRNTWGMFTSPTSYSALFYFLIIKPSITLLFTLLFLVVLLPLMILIAPAPMVLRVVRKIGRWQAVVAVEGLVVSVK
ncbi:hypothetical protein GYMLUDRAFT_35535 [Collybiopsis luxurians FD-317 M1]|nr:hypothetical protein GYMLUDRAFT_35535 [Collybiopsis luxurians FD-317 M1]